MKIALFSIVILMFLAPCAFAVPGLQLFIDGATYDWGSQTWITTDNEFDLYVVSANSSRQDVFVSIALGQGDDPGDALINFDGTNINPDDWVYGYAPMDNLPDEWNGGEDLPRHSIFPTNFAQVNTGDYGLVQQVGDVQPDEDGDYWNPATGEGSAHRLGEVRSFHVTVGGSFSRLHFDAYTLNSDGSISEFAPFSHDAGVVPEPGTILLLSTGLIGLGALRLRRKEN